MEAALGIRASSEDNEKIPPANPPLPPPLLALLKFDFEGGGKKDLLGD